MNQSIATPKTFIVDMPNEAPPMSIDLYSDSLSWMDLLPSNYWNIDLANAKRDLLGGWPVLTVQSVIIKPVLDPELPDTKQDYSPKIVINFGPNQPELVCNKTRCKQIQEMTKTISPRRWGTLLAGKQVELYVGIERDMSRSEQLLIRFAPVVAAPVNGNGSGSIDDLNSELFG